jgi:MFS family permease
VRTAPSGHADHAPEHGHRTLTLGGLFVLTLGALDFGLEQSIVVPALPRLAEHYDASLTAVSWLVTGFLLASIVSVPLVGRLGDIYGKRRMLLVSLAAFALGSLVCALTDSIGVAILGRVLQGVGSGVAPLAYGIARDLFRPEFLPRAIGAVVGAASAGGAIGYLLSGLLVDAFGPTSVFWFLCLLPLVLGPAVFLFVPESPVRAAVRVDVRGAVLLAGGLALLLLAISKGREWEWTSGLTLGVLAAALALLAAFAFVETRVRDPLVDLGLLVTQPFTSAYACSVAFGFVFFLAVFLIPPLVAAPESTGYGLGLDTLEVGLVLFPTGLVTVVSAWASGRLVDRVGPRWLVATGAVVGVAGYTWLALSHASAVAIGAGSAIIGIAWGTVLTGVASIVVRSARQDQTSIAVAVNVVVRNTSVAIGAQVAFAIVAAAPVVAGFPAESGYTNAFWMGAAGAGVLLASSLLLRGRPPRAVT